MQRVIGYMLTGDVREQVFWVWHGEGANGKSTLGEVLLKLLGPLGTTMPFPSRRWDEGREETRKAMLLGRRFVQSSELRIGDSLNEQLVKELVGGDTINARHLYGRSFTFEPTAKFCMRVNQRPKIDDESPGMWRRVRLIPFVEKFDETKADKTLMTTLLSELPGILNWAIRGCLDWQRGGLQEPDCVLAATRDYRTEQNHFERFLADCCDLGAGSVQAGALYNAYAQWAGMDGIPQGERLSPHKFGARVGQRFEKDRKTGGVFYRGLQLSVRQAA
jgi:putative DNA primase/helicase